MYFQSFCVLLLFCICSNAIPILSGANNVCQESNGYLAISGSCDLYILCKDFTPTNEICPDGLHFNNATKFPDAPCSYPKDVPCKDQISQKPKPKDNCLRQNGLFPLSSDGKNDCKKYYMCKEGVSTEMSCDDGLVFNPDSARCDKPDTVPACKETAKEPDTSKLTTTEATTTSEVKTPNPTEEPITPVTAPTVEPTSATSNDTTTSNPNDVTTISPSVSTESTSNDTTTSSVTPDYQMIILPTSSQPNATSSTRTTPTSSSGAEEETTTTTSPTSSSGADNETTTTTLPTSSSGADVETTTTSSPTTPTSSSDANVEITTTTTTTPPASSTTPTSSSDADGDTTKPSSSTTPIVNKEASSTSTTTTEASLQTDSTNQPLNPGTTKRPGNQLVTAVITYGSISMSDVRMSIPIV